MLFEYKVRAKHKLGFKEFKLYADTDIEEFFNRNNIKYVRNMTDTVENKQQKKMEKAIEYIHENHKHFGIDEKDYVDVNGLLKILENK